MEKGDKGDLSHTIPEASFVNITTSPPVSPLLARRGGGKKKGRYPFKIPILTNQLLICLLIEKALKMEMNHRLKLYYIYLFYQG